MSNAISSCVFAFRGLVLLCLFVFTTLAVLDGPAMAAGPSDTLIVREALGITLPRRTVSSVIPSTPVDAWFTGSRTDPPGEGESIRSADGTSVTWQRIVPDSNGWFPAEPPAERYAAVTIDRKAPTRMILEGMGHDIVYVNGTPRSGNPYQQSDNPSPWEPHFDYSSIPVDLHQGQNLLVFRYSRGGLKVRLLPVTKPIAFNAKDVTLPDAVIGAALDAWGSIAVINSSSATVKGCALVCLPTGGKPDTIDVPYVPAMGVRKLAFRIRTLPRAEKGNLPLQLTLLARTSTRRERDRHGDDLPSHCRG